MRVFLLGVLINLILSVSALAREGRDNCPPDRPSILRLYRIDPLIGGVRSFSYEFDGFNNIADQNETTFSLTQIFDYEKLGGILESRLNRKPQKVAPNPEIDDLSYALLFVANGFFNGSVVESVDKSFSSQFGPTVFLGFKQSEGGIDLQNPLGKVENSINLNGHIMSVAQLDIPKLTSALTTAARQRFGNFVGVQYDSKGTITRLLFTNMVLEKDEAGQSFIGRDSNQRRIRFITTAVY